MKQYPTEEAIHQDVWVKAWCAVASSSNCQRSTVATTWADTCLEDFKSRFKKG